MYRQIATVFNKIEDGDDYIYQPTVVTGCFICKTVKAIDSANGVGQSSIGKCVIPRDAITSREFAAESDYEAMDVEQKKAHWTLREGDMVVSGSVPEESLTLTDITRLTNSFQIKTVTDTSFSSEDMWMVTGV